MKLIVGLGNPGLEYQSSRHNAGFMFLDWLKEELHADDFLFEKKLNGETSQVRLNSDSWLLLKPQTYMNLSGDSVASVVNYYRISLDKVMIIYDDLDLAVGIFRLRKNGSAGTHNGMKSVLAALGSEDVARLRFGIESRTLEQKKLIDAKDFVLGKFSKSEFLSFKKTWISALDRIQQLFT